METCGPKFSLADPLPHSSVKWSSEFILTKVHSCGQFLINIGEGIDVTLGVAVLPSVVLSTTYSMKSLMGLVTRNETCPTTADTSCHLMMITARAE